MTGLNGPCGGAACFTAAQAHAPARAARWHACAPGDRLLAGASNFDIGHMALGRNAGGMSSIGVVGGNNKAMGCTGIATPVG